MNLKFKRFLSVVLLAGLVATGCGSASGSITAAEAESNAPAPAGKPTQITMMVDGTLVDVENGQAEFEAKWEELTGIDLVINQPGHDIYYDEVTKAFDSLELPDVILLNSTYYTKYVQNDMIADITSYYEGSELQAKIKAAGKEDMINAIRIDGKLFGMTPTRGNGCVTYIKKAWLDNVGLQAPTTYDEYIEMLKAFTEGDPDGNGVKGDTYGVSASGIVNGEAPYINYLPEFFQDAYPSFHLSEDGSWVDGFLEEPMKAAIQRLADAYAAGYIDKTIIDNSTSDCRDKFYANEYGVFTYWAGTWAKTLSDKCIEAGIDGEIVTIPPIAETGKYLERVAPVWCITSACKNPEGVYKYFIETMLDGGDVEALWTYKPGTEDFSKNHIDHVLAVVPIENDPGADSITESQAEAMEIFDTNSVMADLPKGTEAYSLYNDDLIKLKQELVKKVVVDGVDIDTAFADFEAAKGVYMSQAIVDSLNAE